MLGTLFCDDNVVHGHGGEGGGLLCGGETVGGGGGTVQQGIMSLVKNHGKLNSRDDSGTFL